MGKRKKKLSEFGEFLVAEIYKAGMSKVDFCTAVGINKQISLRQIRFNQMTCLIRLLNAGRKYQQTSTI